MAVIKVILMLTFVLASGAASAAAAPQASHESRWSMTHHYRGTVQAVDPASGTLTVRRRSGAVKEFSTDASSKITARGKPVGLGEVSVGDQVSVSYKGKAAAPTAESVKVRKAK